MACCTYPPVDHRAVQQSNAGRSADRCRTEDHALPLIVSISKPLFVEHLGIQLAVQRFRHKARKSTANVHQTHNQRALMNGTREFTAPRRLNGESDGPAQKRREISTTYAGAGKLSILRTSSGSAISRPLARAVSATANPTPDRDDPQCRARYCLRAWPRRQRDRRDSHQRYWRSKCSFVCCNCYSWWG